MKKKKLRTNQKSKEFNNKKKLKDKGQNTPKLKKNEMLTSLIQKKRFKLLRKRKLMKWLY